MGLTKIDDRGLNTPIELLDDEEIRLGNSDDCKIYHDSTTNHTFIEQTSSVNALIIRANHPRLKSYTGNETMLGANSNGNVELYYNGSKKLETTNTGVAVSGEFTSGTGAITGDLAIGGEVNLTTGGNYNRFIDCSLDNGEALFLRSTNGGDANHQNMALFHRQGSVELYHAAAKKFETKSDGVDIIGELQCDSLDVDGSVEFTPGSNNFVNFFGASNHAKWDFSNSRLTFDDNAKAGFGNSADLQIYHDGTHSYIYNTTGELKNRAAIWKVVNAANSEKMIEATENGSVDLYYDNSNKFQTVSDGVRVTGHLHANDNYNIKLGNGNDLEIVHNGSHSIAKNKTGDFYLAGNSVKLVNEAINQDMLTATAGGAVQLNNNGTERLKTKSYGVHINGYKTQFNPPGFMGDAADWSSSQPNMHNMSLMWNSGHLNNSTGVFTCPVAGKYLCSASVQAHRTYNSSGASSTYYNVLWQKNNSNYHVEMVGTSSTDAGARSTTDVNGKHETVTATVVMECAANDTIRAHSNHGYRHNSQNIITVILLG
tara:strand:+ start:1536 stop:3161 length:1626 start_codon:yes stop_codon:yes gene_type:complete